MLFQFYFPSERRYRAYVWLDSAVSELRAFCEGLNDDVMKLADIWGGYTIDLQ